VASLREIGALGSIGLRSFVIAMGLEDAMPFKLLVYVAFACPPSAPLRRRAVFT
jgi:hypothetical protein